ncbi:putative reverse transcriptase zinc-binding domain-containing protein [Helianthus annuus]|uniref:Reverse transcriptase zinc-binding domain-containing protein n=2 Tax=Helianthus annuus TaxID=4232 RepID=A0A9K3NUX5_HELAN|nr:putative reverse transcriptase zinc-binding domain-containing protein [Helianthus annuus]KAJ0582834.1 putative reverse transcriptase zinc-binding domain-containing protein [Helianthus annuus]KAJ0598815.1 putative reverse transcriptase zinc-binding domain-containing protein [Helianthus annuus]KAJ0933382.1 putative reverse transcriptase zinc-binding domain-containing protein [Helianthus annuus]
MLGKVASRVGLSRRGVHLTDVSCPRCGLQDEDSDHIFVTCLWARSIWWNMLVWMRINFPADIISLEEFVSYLHNQPGGKRWKKIVYTVTLATVWRIWKARNEKVFEDRFIPVQTSVELIKEDAFLWLGNRSKLQLTDWIKWKSFDISEVL